MKKYVLYCIIILLAAKAGAQDSYSDRAVKYIAQYNALAIAEQKTYGIPASVTLGQGILETEAGASELMTEANNHFGIKCKKDWRGDTFTHDDDAPGECFKKYTCAADSYRDHSEHLKKTPRYASLFALPKTDYAAWARGLRSCGYATNPQYAEQLIKIIEDYKLQDYTYSAMDSVLNNSTATTSTTSSDIPVAASVKKYGPVATQPLPQKKDTVKKTAAATDTVQKSGTAASPTPVQQMADSARRKILVTDPVPAAKTDTPLKTTAVPKYKGADSKYDSGKVVLVNGLRAFYAMKGDMLLKYAVMYNVRYQHLLEINDLADTSLPFNMYVYLEKKLAYGTHAKHTVADGETLLMIAQEEGMQVKRIMALNYLHPHDEPATGAVIELQAMAVRKPDTRISGFVAHKQNTIATGNDTASSGDYISLRKPAADTPMVEESVNIAKPYVTYVAGSDYKGDQANAPELAAKDDTAKEEDLSGLKAELDKVVYADDSKLPQTKQEAPLKKPVEEAKKPAEKNTGKFYKVKRGDTAFGIAKKNNITVKQLLKWNDIDADEIRAGKNLRVKE